MDIRSRFELGPRVQLIVSGSGRTRQSFKDECDINMIMAKFVKTGAVDHSTKHGGSYGFATSISFHEAMNVVTKAEAMFMDLPSVVRKRFGNDPADFLEFVQDPANSEALQEMGLGESLPVEVDPDIPPARKTPPEAPEEPEALPTG